MTWRNRLTGVVIFFTVGCTPMMYGVPVETWDTLSEAQRLETINGYNQRQLALQQARAEAAKVRAAALEKQRQREAEEARLRQVRVDAVYRGEGHYGDLLRVTIRGGDLNFSGKQRPYDSLSFKIADGEVKKLRVTGDKNRQTTLVVSYLDGTLIIDDPATNANRRRGIRLGYDPSWGQGKTYEGIVSNGPLRMRGAAVAVQIASDQAPVAEERQPQIIIVQQPAPPQTIIVKERPRHHVDQKVVVVNSPPVAVVPPQQVIVSRPKQPQRSSPRYIDTSPRAEEDHGHPDKILHAEDAKMERKPAEDERQGVEPPSETVNATQDRKEKKAKRSVDEQRVSAGEKPLMVTLNLKGQGKGLEKKLSPVTFSIRAGETLQVPLSRAQGSAKFLLVAYQDGILYLDGDQTGKWKQSKATALAYDATWTQGHRYQITTRGPASIREGEVFIQETL